MPKQTCNRNSPKSKLLITFTDKPVTAMGGLITIARWFEGIGIREDISKHLEGLRPGLNRGCDPEEVWHHYNKRADVENRVKEWKDDFFMDAFSLKRFFATEATVWVIAILFNLMSWYRASTLKDAPRLMTMRLRQFLCGGILGREGRRKCLRLNPGDTMWQQWIQNILDTVDKFSFSNATQLKSPT